MNGRKAKELRQKIYDVYYSPRYRVYMRQRDGSIIADSRRRQYQSLKKEF